MNPMTNIKNTQKISEREISLGTAGTKTSWHNKYKDSAWIFIGGLPYELTEGDVVCVFSQFGEIVNCNMVRDQKTGKSKGFMFMCYEDQRSTVLAVDNLNGSKLLKRSIRVDHVLDYKLPKDHDNDDDVTRSLREQGCAPQIQPSSESDNDPGYEIIPPMDVKEEKKSKKKKKEKKKKKPRASSTDSSENKSSSKYVKKETTVKKEKIDQDYPDPANRPGRHSNGDVTETKRRSDHHHRDESNYEHGRHGDTRKHSGYHGDERSGYHGDGERKGSERYDRCEASSSRRRSRSPRQPPTSRGRSRSPRRREPSPRQRNNNNRSPRRRSRSGSPRQPSSPTGRGRSRSPRRREPSPRQRNNNRSPRRRSRSGERRR